MEWKDWSSVAFTERYCLPSCSGIYVIVDANDCVWYVGQAANIKARGKEQNTSSLSTIDSLKQKTLLQNLLERTFSWGLPKNKLSQKNQETIFIQ